MNLKTAMLQSGKNYCLDMDTTVATHDKYDKKHTYNKEQGYNPLVAVLGNCPVYIEGRSGNTSPAFGLAGAVKNTRSIYKRRDFCYKDGISRNDIYEHCQHLA